MDMEEIQTFLTLAECKNFTRTGELQHIVQSTVSNRIRSLEEYTGTQLVIRDKSGVRLTMEGNLFLEYAKRIKELDSLALHEIHMLKNYDDRLNVACAQWIFDYFVGDCMKEFSRVYDKIALNVTIAHSEEILSMIQDQIYDFGVLAYKANAANLINVPFAVSDIIFVGNADRYGHLRNGICKGDLVSLPLIYSDIWDRYLSEISDNLLPDGRIFRMHCNMLNIAKNFCLDGIGCCFFPEIMVKKEMEEERLVKIPIEDLPIKHFKIHLVYNKNRMGSIAVKNWLKLFPKLGPE